LCSKIDKTLEERNRVSSPNLDSVINHWKKPSFFGGLNFLSQSIKQAEPVSNAQALAETDLQNSPLYVKLFTDIWIR
jgi:hypothetical protein